MVTTASMRLLGAAAASGSRCIISAGRCSLAPAARGARCLATATAAHGNNLVFLGPPGVGKGTFAGRIAKKLGVPAISTGDIIRGEIKAGTALGAKVVAFSDAGQLVPDEIVTAMVKHRLDQPDAKAGYILVRGGEADVRSAVICWIFAYS